MPALGALDLSTDMAGWLVHLRRNPPITARQAVLAAAALRCLGGELQAQQRDVRRLVEDRERLRTFVCAVEEVGAVELRLLRVAAERELGLELAVDLHGGEPVAAAALNFLPDAALAAFLAAFLVAFLVAFPAAFLLELLALYLARKGVIIA